MRIRHLTTLVAIVLAVAMVGMTAGCPPEEEPPPPPAPDNANAVDPPDDPLLPGDNGDDGDTEGDGEELPW